MGRKSPSSKNYGALLRSNPFIVLFVAYPAAAVILAIAACLIGGDIRAQEFKTGPDVKMAGDVRQEKNSFNHRTYSGTVQNTQTWRIDFVRVEFRLFNKEGRMILRKDVFVDGKEFLFQDGRISRSSLDPDQKADFICLTPVHVDSIAKFEHTIYWMEYDSLPKQAF